MDQYQTIKKQAEARLDINKSQFIAISFPLDESSDPEQLILSTKQIYPEATHYVYAYIYGLNQAVQKFSDDGEPSGTGGLPILELLKYRKLENTLVVVVRYYGGIKLGTGGLKRAYSKAAQEALHKSKIITLTASRILHLVCPYPYWGKMQYELENRQTLVDGIIYKEFVSLTVAVPQGQVEAFSEWIQGLTASQAVIEPLHLEYRQIPND
jgi:uncharacterized YigZ family protein